MIAFERDHIRYRGVARSAEEGIQTRIGSRPIVLSAPHATRHRRANYWKQEDEYTGAIAEALHLATDAHAIYTTHQSNPDPHDDGPGNAYKQALADLVAVHPVCLVLDLHGVRGDRPFAVGLGTMNGVSCPTYEALIVAAFRGEGFSTDKKRARLDRLALNHPRYTGGLRHPTITRFVSQTLGIAAAQLELNAWVRVLQRLPTASNSQRGQAPNFRADEARFRRVFAALCAIIQQVSDQQTDHPSDERD